jgi:hypothetical protein
MSLVMGVALALHGLLRDAGLDLASEGGDPEGVERDAN